MFSQLFTVAVLAISAQSVFAADCTRSYTVQEGDICDTISQAHNVSTWQLATVNTGSVNGDCTNLIPGQTICLGLKPEEDCTTTYTVASGDTCDAIVSSNAVNSTILHLNNPQINEDCSNIYVGEVLCTAKTVQVPPTPASGVTLPPPATVPNTTPASTPSPATVPDTVPNTTPASTPSPATVPDTTPASTPTPVANAAPIKNSNNNNDDDGDDDTTNDDDNDDDLPFCDEI